MRRTGKSNVRNHHLSNLHKRNPAQAKRTIERRTRREGDKECAIESTPDPYCGPACGFLLGLGDCRIEECDDDAQEEDRRVKICELQKFLSWVFTENPNSVD